MAQRGARRRAGAREQRARKGQSVALAHKVLKLIPVPISFWRLWGTLFRLAQAAAATATADPPRNSNTNLARVARVRFNPFTSDCDAPSTSVHILISF